MSDVLLIFAVQHADAEKQHAHRVAVATLHECDNLYSFARFEQCEAKSDEENHQWNRHCASAQPLHVVEHIVEHHEGDACHEQSAEKPERSGEKLIVASHGEHYVGEPLPELVDGVGMCGAASPVAVDLVENAYLEQQVVDEQKEDAPFHERHVKTFEALHDKRPWVFHRLVLEEIARGDEKQRHVKQVDGAVEHAGHVGVGHHHEDDGKAFGYGDGVVALLCHAT